MLDSKICRYCGLPFEWRKKWENNWDDIKLCSDRCRKSTNSKLDQTIENNILEFLNDKDPGKSICPSEVVRALFENEERWRSEMERVRCAARRLAHQNKIEITQKNKVVEPSNFKGPIRLRKKL